MDDELHIEAKVVRGVPPNYTAIVAAFPAANKPGVIFAYHDTIYVRGEVELTPSLLEHEKVHLRQQATFCEEVGAGRSAWLWWQHYLVDPQFRAEQELEAHIVEYAHVLKSGLNRDGRRKACAQIAARLSGPLYGRCIGKLKVIAHLRAVESACVEK